jgi:hypothetical protein
VWILDQFIASTPNIQEYISPYIGRVEDDCPEDLADDIVAQYTQSQEEEEEEEEVEPVASPPPITHEEALHSLHILRGGEQGWQ